MRRARGGDTSRRVFFLVGPSPDRARSDSDQSKRGRRRAFASIQFGRGGIEGFPAAGTRPASARGGRRLARARARLSLSLAPPGRASSSCCAGAQGIRCGRAEHQTAAVMVGVGVGVLVRRAAQRGGGGRAGPAFLFGF